MCKGSGQDRYRRALSTQIELPEGLLDEVAVARRYIEELLSATILLGLVVPADLDETCEERLATLQVLGLGHGQLLILRLAMWEAAKYGGRVRRGSYPSAEIKQWYSARTEVATYAC